MQPSLRKLASISLAIALLLSSISLAAAKKYQVTGKVIEMNDKTIVVQTTKGDERWEIDRSADMKITGDLKIGAKVTIEYRMVAQTVEVKPEK